ncbi:PRD domain-containing protein [Clostridioides sp. ES-S-0108-01]|uniref:BglG family transcription antiterminator LicT n=1 Tax=Clostridioides sp. ES-S-0108-01 TaxID=2770773 RepID=UPI001D0CCE46|nr:PRD domain-containing protein [Clostridioides sp. ES-S-0108-01]UDN51121.1 PRD domain-containing protein [Clostridioides sp. ES-S-0107-01]
MNITKIFNNNAVVATDTSKNEIVVMGCGIAFKKSVGEKVDEKLVQKTFILKQNEASEKFKLLLEDIPIEHVSLSYDIIEYSKNILNVEMNDHIYVTLTDHISYAIKLASEGLKRPNALIWEIKKFYPKEFKIGIKSLEFIEGKIGIKLEEDEAANIALHLMNAQISRTSNKVEDAIKITKMVSEILNIVTYTYNIELDENSLNYERFVTHLRFFFKRIYNNEKSYLDDDNLLNQIKVKYPKAYNCVNKIEKYLEKNLDSSERLYLTLHIQRVTSV